MPSDNAIAKRILGRLDAEVVPVMKTNARIVKEFTDKLQLEIRKPRHDISPLKGATILHGGSAFEGLTVDEEVDFDIIISLGKPYLAEKFSVRRDPSGFFSMKWKPNAFGKRFSDHEAFLDFAALRDQVFSEMSECLDNIHLNGAKITSNCGACAMQAFIYYNGKQISLDLVPHITFHSWDNCPDLKPLDEMPSALRSYIETLNENGSPTFFFSLCVPWMRENPRLCNISFAMLEKAFVTSDVKVRSMVRLVKFVAYKSGWKKYSFQSYFGKRMALKHYDALKEMDLWDGYKAILHYLWLELQTGTIDGYFIANQKTYMRKQDIARRLQDEIERTLPKSASEIETLL